AGVFHPVRRHRHAAAGRGRPGGPVLMAEEDFPVQARALNHWFGSGEARKQALYDIDLRLARGGLTVLVGPSGSGKTTLLTLLGCLREVQEGSVTLLGHELHGAAPALAMALRR